MASFSARGQHPHTIQQALIARWLAMAPERHSGPGWTPPGGFDRYPGRIVEIRNPEIQEGAYLNLMRLDNRLLPSYRKLEDARHLISLDNPSRAASI